MSFFRQLFGGTKKKSSKIESQSKQNVDGNASKNNTNNNNNIANRSTAVTSPHAGSTKNNMNSSSSNASNVLSKQSPLEVEFEKQLRKSTLTSGSMHRVQSIDINLTRLFLEGKKGISTEAAATQFFRVITSRDLTIVAKLKSASILHKFIIELGDAFAQLVLQANLLSILDYQQSQDAHQPAANPLQSDTLLHEQILTPYFNYILRLANNYQIYKICIEDCMLPQSEDTKLDYKLKFMWLFKLSNLLGYVLKMQRSLVQVLAHDNSQQLLIRSNTKPATSTATAAATTSLPNQQQLQFLQDVALLVLHDCACYYNVMSTEMEQLLGTYHLLTAIDGIQFYSVFEQLITLTQDMRSFYASKYLFDHGNLIEEPAWFAAASSKRTQQQVADYAVKIELLNTSAACMRRTLKGTSAHESQKCNFTETSLPEAITKPSAYSRSKSFSKIDDADSHKNHKKQSKQKNNPTNNNENPDEQQEIQWCKTNQSDSDDNDDNNYKTYLNGSNDDSQAAYIKWDLPQHQIDELKQYEQLLLMQRRSGSQETPRENDNNNCNNLNYNSNNSKMGLGNHMNNKNINNAQKLQPFPSAKQSQSLSTKQEATRTKYATLEVPAEQEILFSPGKPFTFRCKTPAQVRTQLEIPPTLDNVLETPEIIEEDPNTAECGFNRGYSKKENQESQPSGHHQSQQAEVNRLHENYREQELTIANHPFLKNDEVKVDEEKLQTPRLSDPPNSQIEGAQQDKDIINSNPQKQEEQESNEPSVDSINGKETTTVAQEPQEHEGNNSNNSDQSVPEESEEKGNRVHSNHEKQEIQVNDQQSNAVEEVENDAANPQEVSVDLQQE